MKSKIRSSMEGVRARVIDSVQPVHSWKDNQITDWRRALASPCAMAVAAVGGRVRIEAV
jgi:hypothetical protein